MIRAAVLVALAVSTCPREVEWTSPALSAIELEPGVATRPEPVQLEETDVAGTITVARFAVTCDEMPTTLWTLEGKEFPLVLEVGARALAHAGASATTGGRRKVTHARMRLGEVDFERYCFLDSAVPCGVLEDPSPTSEAGSTAVFSTYEPALRTECGLWSPLLAAGGVPHSSAFGAARALQRLGIPYGLSQLAPAGATHLDEAVSALCVFLNECFEAALAKSAAAPSDDGLVHAFARSTASPDLRNVLVPLWKHLWWRDAGIRDIDPSSVKSDVRFSHEGRSTFAGNDPAVFDKVESSGSTRLHGKLSFVTTNESWPAPWTCELDVTVAWTAVSRWKR